MKPSYLWRKQSKTPRIKLYTLRVKAAKEAPTTRGRARDVSGMTRDANGMSLNGHSGAPLHLLPTYRVQRNASGMNRDVNGTHRDRHANGMNLNGAPLHPLPAFRALPEITSPKGKATAR